MKDLRGMSFIVGGSTWFGYARTGQAVMPIISMGGPVTPAAGCWSGWAGGLHKKTGLHERRERIGQVEPPAAIDLAA